MPLSITPVSQQDNPFTSIFEDPYSAQEEARGGISDMQMYMMGTTPEMFVRTSGKAIDPVFGPCLQAIFDSTDEKLTKLSQATGASRKPMFSVPRSVVDADLLRLKTAGLINGYGRSVTFTERGKIALRDYWLRSSNKLTEKRTKTQHVHPTGPKMISASENLVKMTRDAKKPTNEPGTDGLMRFKKTQ